MNGSGLKPLILRELGWLITKPATCHIATGACKAVASGNDVADVSSVAKVTIVAPPTPVAMWQVALLEPRVFKFFYDFYQKI